MNRCLGAATQNGDAAPVITGAESSPYNILLFDTFLHRFLYTKEDFRLEARAEVEMEKIKISYCC